MCGGGELLFKEMQFNNNNNNKINKQIKNDEIFNANFSAIKKITNIFSFFNIDTLNLHYFSTCLGNVKRI